MIGSGLAVLTMASTHILVMSLRTISKGIGGAPFVVCRSKVIIQENAVLGNG